MDQKPTLSEEGVAKLANMTVQRLAQHLEHFLIHAELIPMDMNVLEFIEKCLPEE